MSAYRYDPSASRRACLVDQLPITATGLTLHYRLGARVLDDAADGRAEPR